MPNKLVRVKWKYGNELFEEIVELVSDDAKVKTLDGRDVNFQILDILQKENYVLFEDYEGIFGLKPECIISIDEIKKGSKGA
jgi:hypothetical protein